MKSLFIIDASGYLHRAYHAITSMTNPQGESTNALFGFVRSLLKLSNDFKPTHLVCVFDGPESTKRRKAIYGEYKSHRPPLAPDLAYQINWAKEYCQLAGIPLLSVPEVEADDTIGSVALLERDEFDTIFLCTSDKDMAQLVDHKIKILNTHKDNLIIDPAGVENIFGVRPDQILDYLALTGDASDNIPGIEGFGPKTAATILKEWNTLDNALQHAGEIKGKKGETLKNEGEKAILSRQLAMIDTTVEVPKESAFYQIQLPSRENLLQFFNQMGFHSMIKDLGEEKKTSAPVTYHLVDDEKSASDLLKKLKAKQDVAFDTETTSEKPMLAELVGVGFSLREGEGYYIPLNGNLGKERALEILKEIFSYKEPSFFGHNAKYDCIVLKNHGIEVVPAFDTILASYILNSNERLHSLDTLAAKYFGFTKTKTSELLGKGKQETTMDKVPIGQVSAYCCEDVDYTYRLKNIFEKELEERGLKELFKGLELALLPVLQEMEMHGIFLDTKRLSAIKENVTIALDMVKEEIFQMAGEEFNLNSPKQLSEILFNKLMIRPPKKTATGFSTNQEVLEELKNSYPIAEKLIEWRVLEKMRSTYIDTLPLEVNPRTHRIHTTFNQFVAATGRLSSQDPNLQNIPARHPIGLLIREAFRPEKAGWSFLSSDYSQIELRLLAHFSEDKALIEAFSKGEDIHATTAAHIFGIALPFVTKEMRQLAKAVNFGIIYGQGSFGLSQTLKIDLKQAKSFIETYFARFPKVKAYIEECKEVVRKSGKAVTFTGRERAIPEIHNKNMQIRQLAERLAVNTPLQGGAADLIKMAMLKIQTRLKNERFEGYMILQIHDELIFEAPEGEIDALKLLVKEEMENAYRFKVPLTVNCEVGKNWKEC